MEINRQGRGGNCCISDNFMFIFQEICVVVTDLLKPQHWKSKKNKGGKKKKKGKTKA